MSEKKIIIHLIAAARPNFMKIAPLYHAVKGEDRIMPLIVHTGQHYDINMSDTFFRDLQLPEPDFHLGTGSGSHAAQTAKVLVACENLFIQQRPDLVVVVGDVNSTMAATLAAVKLQVPIAHLEAGLRSFDRSMPEEINRLVTDALADLLWTPSPDADENLLHEGIPRQRIVRVGNIMIDSLEMLRPSIENDKTYKGFNFQRQKYGVVTLHRPANVDPYQTLELLCTELVSTSEIMPLIFPIHPRTKKNIEKFGFDQILFKAKGLKMVTPMSYIPFMNLIFNSGLVITDSGGLQEETTYLGIPCLTLRPNTERPITITQGTNQLCNPEDIAEMVKSILEQKNHHGQIPKLWDGKTAERVVNSIKKFFYQGY